MNENTQYGYIYKITNKINNKCYLGQTTDLKTRKKAYRDWKWKCVHQEKLYNAFMKYGYDNFTFEVLDDAQDQDTLDFLENIYMLCYDSIQSGYNIREGGANGKMSEETKQKMRNIKRSDEFKAKVSTNNARYWLGKKMPPEMVEKQTASRRGDKHCNYGKHLSEETRRKISKAKTGFKHSEETKQKISKNSGKGMLGRHQTLEAKLLISSKQRGENSVHFGKHLSEEHKKKIAEAVKLTKAARRFNS